MTLQDGLDTSSDKMDAATSSAILATAPEFVGKDLTSILLREKAASGTGVDATDHTNGDSNDPSAADTRAAETHAQHMDGQSDKAAPTLSNDVFTPKTGVDGQTEAAPAHGTNGTNGNSSPQNTKKHHEPDAVDNKAGGSKCAPSNTWTADAVNGDSNGKVTLAPIPLTNGHQQDSVGAPSVKVDLEDFWSPATQLKHRLEDTKELIVCPGVYDGFSARIALSVGFDAMYMTGAGTTASKLGMADLGVASRTDMKEHADMIANLDPSKMLIADMDTGYGGPITITTTVNQYIRANVAGFHIEDQLLTKRCGHLAGKQVVSQEVYLSRIKAAKTAKDKAHSDIVLIARTDANQQHGYEECLTRLRAARDLGANVGLLEGFKSKDEARRAVRDLAPWPLLLNVVENGHSPLITVDEAREMGFRLIIFSFGALVPAYLAIKGAFERLKNEGVTGVHETEVSPRSIFDVCGLEEAMEVDEIAGGEDFKGGV